MDGNYPPIQSYVHAYTVNSKSVIVFAAELRINLQPIIVKLIVTMQGSVYCKQRTDTEQQLG